MFTQRAFLLGFVGFCFYLIAVVNTLPSFYYVLTWLSLGLLAASLGIALLSLSGLEVTGKFSRRQGFSRFSARYLNTEDEASKNIASALAGATPLFEMSLYNKGSLNKTGVILELQFRSLLDVAEKGDEAPIGAHQFLLEAIPAGQTLEISLPLNLLPRGRHELVHARMLGSDVLGLFRMSRKLKLVGEIIESQGEEKKLKAEIEAAQIVVAPPLLDNTTGQLSIGMGHGLSGSRRARQFGRGEDVRALRPYIAGDDLRHIHWKASARSGSMVVKEWEHSSRSSALVVWDGSLRNPVSTGKEKQPVSGAYSKAICEIGLTVASSIVAAFHRSELPCASVLLSQKPVMLSGGGAYSNALSNSEIEAFANAQANRAGSLEAAFEHSGCNESLYDAIYLIAAKTSPEFIGMISRWISRGIAVSVILLDDVPLINSKRGKSSKRQKVALGKQKPNVAVQDINTLRRTGASVYELSLEMLTNQPLDATLDEITPAASAQLELEIRRVMAELNRKTVSK